VFGRTSADTFLRTYSPSALSVGYASNAGYASSAGTASNANGLNGGTTDGDKVHALNNSLGTSNGWTRSYLPSGKRIYAYQVNVGGTPSAQDWLAATITTPDSLSMRTPNLVMTCTIEGPNANQVHVGLRTDFVGQSIQIAVSTVDGATISSKGSQYWFNLIAMEI
jgi:hypothetical protein